MVLKFPSGMVSVSIRDLCQTPHTQSTCGICNKPWFINSHGCIGGQLHVLHPCQHLVGSRCWYNVPDEHQEKCPVCKVEVGCDERVRVHSAIAMFAPASQTLNGQDPDSQVPFFSGPGSGEIQKDSQAEEVAVDKKMREGLNDVDVRAIMYYMNLRARLDTTKGSLGTLLASTKTLTPAHRDRLVLFLANSPQSHQDNAHRRVEVALSAFNISGGTNFTMNDLRKILSSAEDWIQRHFAAIFDESSAANEDASSLRELEEELAEVQAGIRDLKDRQSRESAQRLEGNIKLACQEIGKKADEDAAKVLAMARKEAAKILATARKESAKLHNHRKVINM